MSRSSTLTWNIGQRRMGCSGKLLQGPLEGREVMAANGPSALLAVAVSIGSTLSQQRHLSSVLPFALGIETNLLPQCKHRVIGSIAFLSFRFQSGNVPFAPIPGTCADCRRFPDDVLERSSGRWGECYKPQQGQHACGPRGQILDACPRSNKGAPSRGGKVGNSAAAVGKELAA